MDDPWKPLAYTEGPLFVDYGDWDTSGDVKDGVSFHYLEGYRRAAQLVVGAVESAHDADQFVYPIVFLMRHAVELAMKQVISHLKSPTFGHDLGAVWAECRKVIESVHLQMDADALDLLGERIKELQGRDDQSGTRWRYVPAASDPERAAGAVNLPVFVKRADSICAALDGWDTALSEASVSPRRPAGVEEDRRSSKEDA
jgi:HEPN domain-containing protein